MKVFYGSAIQGNTDADNRQPIHKAVIGAIKESGCDVLTEHTTEPGYENRMQLLESALGTLPPKGPDRTKFIVNQLIQMVEEVAEAAVFELSVPSLGTGIEFAHAYLRPRLGKSEIPLLVLYEKNFWPNDLSRMVRGAHFEYPERIQLREYQQEREAAQFVQEFLGKR